MSVYTHVYFDTPPRTTGVLFAPNTKVATTTLVTDRVRITIAASRRDEIETLRNSFADLVTELNSVLARELDE